MLKFQVSCLRHTSIRAVTNEIYKHQNYN